MKNKLIVITGPTAIGKSELAIQLAQYLKCEIISADSRQFYIETNAGTAKPSIEQLQAVKHHFINSLHVTDDYSAGRFEKDCLALLAMLYNANHTVIMVGGSGLYIDAVLSGIDDVPPSDPFIRKQIENIYEQDGLAALQDFVKLKDPAYFVKCDRNNRQRLMRAAEVIMITGKTYSGFHVKLPATRNFDVIFIGLNTERELLYNRINNRVDEMIENGLKNECELLFEQRHLNALKTVGYNEMFQHLEGKLTFENAVDLIKQHTRNYAKRQLTWFRKYESMKWFEAGNTREMIHYIKSKGLYDQ